METGKAVLRDCVNATLGFQGPEEQTENPAKSLMRMLGPNGSPSAVNFSSILTALKKSEGVRLEISLRRLRRRPQRSLPLLYFKSNRSRFITLTQAATKSFTNFSFASLEA